MERVLKCRKYENLISHQLCIHGQKEEAKERMAQVSYLLKEL